MEETLLKPGEKIKGYRITEPIKCSADGATESYFVRCPDGSRALLKLFKHRNLRKLFEYRTGILFNNEGYFPRVFEWGDTLIGDENYYFLVRSYIEGESLSDIISRRKKRFSWTEAVSVITHICAALRSMQRGSRPIVHNNLTPRNIIISNRGEYVRLFVVGLGHLSYPTMMRAPFAQNDLNNYYRAPETFKGVYNVQTDIFALGVMLYTMITGHEPWNTGEYESSPEVDGVELRLARITMGDTIFDGVQLTKQQRSILRAMLSLDPHKRITSLENLVELLYERSGMLNEDQYPLNVEEWERVEKLRRNYIDADVAEEACAKDDEECPDDTAPTATSTVGERKGFDRVVGLDDVKQMFFRNVLFVLKNPDKAERYKLKMPNGILLYGPPGCGKTFIAEMFAEQIDINFVMVKGSDLGSVYIHGTQGNVAELFRNAESNGPTVICFDELDGMVPNREATTSDLMASEVNEFLCQLNNCADRQIFVIGTTNFPERIDPAVLRKGRIDKMFYVPMPDEHMRKELFRLYLADRYVDSSIDYDELARLSRGFVASDIAYVVDESAITAAISDVEISRSIIIAELRKTKPSVSPAQIARYEASRKTFNGHDGVEVDAVSLGGNGAATEIKAKVVS